MIGMSVYEWLIAGPGILALIGVAVGYGALRQRVKTVEEQLKELLKLPTLIATIEERTSNMNMNVNSLNGKIDSFLGVTLNEMAANMKLTAAAASNARRRPA